MKQNEKLHEELQEVLPCSASLTVNCALWKFTGPSTSGRFFGMKVPDNRDDQPAGWGDGVSVQCST